MRLALHTKDSDSLDISFSKFQRNCKPERRHPSHYLHVEIELGPDRRKELLNELEIDDDCKFRKTDNRKVVRHLTLQAVRDKLEDVENNITYEIDNFFRSESE